MKKYAYLILAGALAFSQAACSKKDEPTPVVNTPDYSQLILGKWVSSSTETVTTTNGQSSTKTTNTAYGDVSEVFTAKTITAYFKSSVVGASSYTISGSTYTIDDGGGATRKFEIVTLNSSSFVRKYTSTSGSTTTVATTTLLR